MKFETDIYISYHPLDNMPPAGHKKGWISEFAELLDARLSEVLQRKAIIQLNPAPDNNRASDKVMSEEFSKVAIMLCIISPRFVKSDRCLNELSLFIDSCERNIGFTVHRTSRALKIIKAPIPKELDPYSLRHFLTYDFYDHGNDGRVRELSMFSAVPDMDFFKRFDALSADVYQFLTDLTTKNEEATPRQPSQKETKVPVAGISTRNPDNQPDGRKQNTKQEPVALAEESGNETNSQKQIEKNIKPISTSPVKETVNIEGSSPKPRKSTGSKRKIFFSYAWGEGREQLVNELYDSLNEEDKYVLIRDKKSLGYKGKISDFEKTIGKGNIVIVAMSQKYLRSENCMFELCELWRNSKLEPKTMIKKIFPINVEEVNLNDLNLRKELKQYWNGLVETYKENVMSNTSEFRSYDKVKFINEQLENLIDILRDINFQSREILSKNGFEEIKNAINGRFK